MKEKTDTKLAYNLLLKGIAQMMSKLILYLEYRLICNYIVLMCVKSAKLHGVNQPLHQANYSELPSKGANSCT